MPLLPKTYSFRRAASHTDTDRRNIQRETCTHINTSGNLSSATQRRPLHQKPLLLVLSSAFLSCSTARLVCAGEESIPRNRSSWMIKKSLTTRPFCLLFSAPGCPAVREVFRFSAASSVRLAWVVPRCEAHGAAGDSLAPSRVFLLENPSIKRQPVSLSTLNKRKQKNELQIKKSYEAADKVRT